MLRATVTSAGRGSTEHCDSTLSFPTHTHTHRTESHFHILAPDCTVLAVCSGPTRHGFGPICACYSLVHLYTNCSCTAQITSHHIITITYVHMYVCIYTAHVYSHHVITLYFYHLIVALQQCLSWLCNEDTTYCSGEQQKQAVEWWTLRGCC